MEKLLVILGPTASGKTTLAVKLADIYNAEIISADSRQIYQGMDIGTGKDLDVYKLKNKKIPYHLIDILSPEIDYSVFQFKNDFHNIFKKLSKNKKLAILCGGTALYIDSVLFNYDMKEAAPNKILREELEKSSINQLSKRLIEINKEAYDNSYHVTKRRIIRTIEILDSNNKKSNKSINKIIHNPLIIGIKVQRDVLLSNIKERLLFRLKEGMIEEVQLLIDNGIDLKRLNYFGLEYKFIGEYLSNNITYNEMINNLNISINRFSKRQMTFFRRMEKQGIIIHWIDPDETDKARDLTKKYLN